MISLHYAWRNLWRNHRRTTLTLAAVSLNTAILIASFSLMDGMLVHTISNATNLVIGEVQIHVPNYLSRRSLYQSLERSDAILEDLRADGVGAAERSYGYGLMAHETKSAGALFWGVDPAVERSTFDLAKHVAQGVFLPDRPEKTVVLGKKLARSLGAAVGSEVVVVVQGADGSLGNDLYTVIGLLKSVGETLDRTAAILHREDFEELFVAEGLVHEIALNTKGQMRVEDLAALASKAAPNEEVRTWRQIMPALSDIVNLFDASIVVFGAIFFLAAGLGVMNTMLMATFERIREFGILKALGTKPRRIVTDVAAEALLLGVLSTLMGSLIGLTGTYFLQEVGIDTRVFAGEISLAGVAFDPVWRAVLSLKTVIIPVVLMLAVCVLASLYPAAIAARLDPVRAMEHV